MGNLKLILFTIVIPGLLLKSCSNENDLVSRKPSPAVAGDSALAMVDLDKVHNPEKEWCYAPKSTTVIGMPFMPRPVQVTYDGALYTRDAEVCFFYGDSLLPLMARQKVFLDGWIPVVQYQWEKDGVNYEMEMFASAIEGLEPDNTLFFTRLRAKNNSTKRRKGVLASASRFTGQDHRFGKPLAVCRAETRFNMNESAFSRDEHLIYTYPARAEKFAVPGERYSGPFAAAAYSVHERMATGLARIEKMLEPGDSLEAVFKMPNFPVPLDQKDKTEAIKRAGYDEYRQKTIRYWKQKIEGETYFMIPEKRVNNSFKAGLVNLMLATRKNPGGKLRQGSGLPYDQLFFNDYVDMRRLYDLSGHSGFVDINVDWLMNYQNEDGMFLDPVLTHGREIMASHGQALVSLAGHYNVSQDTAYAKRVYPSIQKAVNWMHQKHRENSNGLMPASIPFDAEMIKGYYTSHNLWCLLGLRDAIRVARGLGKYQDVREWTQFHQTYKQAILDAIAFSADSTAGRGGYVPTGLYSFITGPEAREGFREHQTNQDWENNLLIYPTEVLDPYDHRIRATLDTIRRKKYREGIMTYRNGMHLHQYATVNQAHQYLAINDQKNALLDLYHILLHNGSTHEGFENMVEPWEDMDPWPIPAPHAWAAAKTSLLIRNMMVREYGGEAGLHEDERSLYLFSVIAPSWINPGESISIKNAVTEMGHLSADLTFTREGCQITIDSRFHTPPASVRLAIPWYVKLQNFSSDASTSGKQEGYLVFSPDVSDVTIRWKVNKKAFENNFQELLASYRRENSLIWRDREDAKIIPGGEAFLLRDELDYPDKPLSFELVKTAFIKEYQRRFSEYVGAGKAPLKVEPPPLIPK